MKDQSRPACRFMIIKKKKVKIMLKKLLPQLGFEPVPLKQVSKAMLSLVSSWMGDLSKTLKIG